MLDDIVGKFPLRRMTEDGEVADVAAFFASDHAKAVTGQYLLVNSGECCDERRARSGSWSGAPASSGGW